MRIVVTIFLPFVCAVLVQAQHIRSFNGTYQGSAYRIEMNGERKTPVGMSFTLKDGTLTGRVPKIGKMPGYIVFRIISVNIDNAGRLHTTSPNAGYMKMMGLFKPTLKWDANAFQGQLKTEGGVKKLFLTLHVYGSMMGKKMPAVVYFKGINK